MSNYLNSYPKHSYEAERISVPGSTTDYDVKDNDTLFGSIGGGGRYDCCRIYSDVEVTVKFNDATNNPIKILAGSAREWLGLISVTNIFITNATGGAAAIDIELM